MAKKREISQLPVKNPQKTPPPKKDISQLPPKGPTPPLYKAFFAILAGSVVLIGCCVFFGGMFGGISPTPPKVTVEALQEIVREEPTATDSPEPTATPAPTRPPTDTPGPTKTPLPPTDTPEPTITPDVPYVVKQSDGDANLRLGPGTDYEVVGVLKNGDSLNIIGRNSDSSWWQVSTQNGEAWVATGIVVAHNVTDNVPVQEPPPLPASVPTLPPPTTSAPTAIAVPATLPPTATAASAPPPQQAVCNCTSDTVNCSGNKSFGRQCHAYCLSIGAGDIHRLDNDDDGAACE